MQKTAYFGATGCHLFLSAKSMVYQKVAPKPIQIKLRGYLNIPLLIVCELHSPESLEGGATLPPCIYKLKSPPPISASKLAENGHVAFRTVLGLAKAKEVGHGKGMFSVKAKGGDLVTAKESFQGKAPARGWRILGEKKPRHCAGAVGLSECGGYALDKVREPDDCERGE